MKFKIGDKVKFLNEKGEGVINKIINKTTVGVIIEDGFEIPFAISELLIIRDETKVQAKTTFVEEPVMVYEARSKNISENKENEGIYLAFSPERSNDIPHSDFNVWLINHTGYQILFSYSISSADGFKTIETGHIQPFENVLIETIDRKLLSESSNFKIDILFFNEKEHEYQLPVSELIKLKPIKLYKENAFSENAFITEKALIINVSKVNTLDDEIELPTDLSKMLFQKNNQYDQPKRSKPHISNNPAKEMEIDLHIEELIDSHRGMSNAEIIQIQLKHLQKTIDRAISEHYRKLVVIHGVGNGRLKSEVQNVIATYNNLRYHDASYSKYGYGATEILIN